MKTLNLDEEMADFRENFFKDHIRAIIKHITKIDPLWKATPMFNSLKLILFDPQSQRRYSSEYHSLQEMYGFLIFIEFITEHSQKGDNYAQRKFSKSVLLKLPTFVRDHFTEHDIAFVGSGTIEKIQRSINSLIEDIIGETKKAPQATEIFLE